MSTKKRLNWVAVQSLYHRGVLLHGEFFAAIIAGFLIILYGFITVVPSIRADYASFNPGTGTVSASYGINQHPSFVVNTDGLSDDVTAKVTSASGQKVPVIPSISQVSNHQNEFFVSFTPNGSLSPGTYTAEVTIGQGKDAKTVTQDFSWGVLAINIAKSSYISGETVRVGMAVLDDRGVTLCDAETHLEVRAPDGTITDFTTQDKTIKVSDTCADKNVTNNPDYFADFIPKQTGNYTLQMTSRTKNGVRAIQSEFLVSGDSAFVSERYDTAMRLYPSAQYGVTLNLHAKEDFSGSIEEKIPDVFTISNPKLSIKDSDGMQRDVDSEYVIHVDGEKRVLRWNNITLEAGDVAKVTYRYNPPAVSPAFYELGPAAMKADSEDIVFEEPRSWQLAGDAVNDVIVLWDTANGAIPAGWTCISCTVGDPFYQVFPRGSSTYGSTGGGPESHAHTYTQSNVTGPSAVASNTNTLFGSRAVGGNTHTHTFPNPTIGNTDIKPPYKNLRFIRASNPLSLPQNAIAMFDVASTASLPANWTSYTALNDPSSTGSAGNGAYLRGENTNTTGGAPTHSHSRSAVTSGTGGTVNVGTSNNKALSNSTHTHTLAAGNTTAEANDPSFITVVFARLTLANDALPNGMMAFFDTTTMPTGWSQQTTIGGNPITDRLIKGSLSAGAIGGRTVHDHGASQVITSGGPSTTINGPNGGLTNSQPATSTHTHDVTYSISSASSMPNYRDVIIGKFATVDFSGTVYSDEGSTPLGSVAVKASINGGAQRNVTAAANGTFTLPMPDPGPGSVLTVWLNTNGGSTGTTVTRTNGGGITGLDIYQNRLVASHEDGGPLSNANIGLCDKSSGTVCTDSDLHFDESSGNLTVDNDWRLYIDNDKTFTPGGAVTLSPGGTAASVGGDLKFGSSGSTLNVSTNAVNVGGDWINTVGGTFTKLTGQTVTMTGTVPGLVVESSSRNFERLTFNGSGGTWAFTPAATTVNIDDNLTITSGTATAPSGTMNVTGNWANSGVFTHNSGTVNFNATTTGKTINAGSSAFYNVTLNGAGGAWSPLTNTMTIANNLTMTNGTLNNAAGAANIAVNGNVQGTAGVINLSNNTFTQRVSTNRNFGTTSGSTVWTFNNLTFSNSNGSTSIVTTQTGGTGNLIINGNLVVSSTGDTAPTVLGAGNRTWQLLNSNGSNPFDMDQAAGSLTGSTSTFEYSGDNDSGNVTVENATYNHLTFGGSVTESYSLEGSTTAVGDLLITANGTLIGTQNMTVNGSATGTGVIALTGGTFSNRVSTSQNFGTTSGSTAWTFNNLSFENSSASPVTITTNPTATGTITTTGAMTIGNAADTSTTLLDNESNDRTIDANGNWTITSQGIYTASSTIPLTVAGSYVNSGTFTANTGLVRFDATTGGRTLSGNMTGGNKFYDLVFNGSGGGWSFGTSSAEVINDMTITNGSVTGPSTSLILTGNYVNTATYIHNSGTIVFNATTSKAITQGVSSPFHHVTFNGNGGTWVFQTNAATMNGDLVMIDGTLNNSVDITVNGSVQCSGTCGTITATSTFTQEVSSNKAFGTNAAVATVWSFHDLVFRASANSPTITFNGSGTGVVNVANDLMLTKAGGAASLVVNDTTNNRAINVEQNVSIALGTTLQAPPTAGFTVAGSWSNSGTLSHGSGTVTFDGTGTNQTINGGSSSFYDVVFDGVGGVWSPVTTTLLVANNLTMTNGTFGSVLDSADVVVNGSVGGDNGVISITNPGRTFIQRVTSGQSFGPTGSGNDWTFSNLTFSNGNGSATPVTVTTVSGTGTITVSEVLRIGVSGDTTGATTTLDAGNRLWYLPGIGGNPFQILASPAGALSPGTSTYTYSGNNGSGNTLVEGADYYKLVISNASETYDSDGATSAISDLDVSAGTYALGANNLTVGSSTVTNSGGIVVASGAALTQTGGTTFLQSSDGGAANIGGPGNVTFYNLTANPAVATEPTFTLGTATSQTVIVNGNLTVGDGTNPALIQVNTYDPVLDVNGDVSILAVGRFVASNTAQFTVGGSWTNVGTFTNANGTVTFDATTPGHIINTGGQTATQRFNNMVFDGPGGWTVQTNNIMAFGDFIVTNIGSLAIDGVMVQVRGIYSICDDCTSGTNWITGSRLYLNSGSSYTIGSKAQDPEQYARIQTGATTHIRFWNSTIDIFSPNATGSIYSQNDNSIVGKLAVYGDYHVTGTDYWQYDIDFDGTSLLGNERQVDVSINSATGRGVTVDGGGTLNIVGGGDGANQFTNVDRSGGSTYHMINNGSAVVREAKIGHASFDGGTWTLLNTVPTSTTVTAGNLQVDWYVSAHAVHADNPSTDIDTAGQDLTVSEASGESTVFKESGGIWGAGAPNQTADTDNNGLTPEPDSDGALRIREYDQTSSATTYYDYDVTIADQPEFASYGYQRDYGSYLTSSANTGSSDSQTIGSSWYRDDISLPNPEGTLNDVVTEGTWYVGVSVGMLGIWDIADGALPNGWNCVSCTGSDPFYQKFLRAAATYGGTGGADTGGHHLSAASPTNGASFTALTGGTSVASGSHTHNWDYPGGVNTSVADIKPPYKNVQVIRGPTTGPNAWPADIIMPFATDTPPANWTAYTALDGRYIRGENDNATGGSATHSHTTNILTSGASSGTAGINSCVSGCTSAASAGHTHSSIPTSTASDDNDPLHTNVRFMKHNDTSQPPLRDMLVLFDHSSLPNYYTLASHASPYQGNLLVGSASDVGTSSGSATHSHGGSVTIPTSTLLESPVDVTAGGGVAVAHATHTHDVTYTVDAANSMPSYRDVIVADYLPNVAPNEPENLIQLKVDDSTISSGQWINETAIKFAADMSDNDETLQELQLCIEVKAISVAFTDVEDQCSAIVEETGTGSVAAAVTILGYDEDEYHWQARVKDQFDEYSAWTSYDTNDENTRDFGIDTTAPATANVYDNSNLDSQPADVDADENADGSLTTLSATWVHYDASISGLDRYQYSIGTTPAGTDVKNWTDTGTTRTIRDSTLDLQTSQQYYVNVRAIDNANNVSSVASSNGQTVTPTLTFDIDVNSSNADTAPPYFVDLGGLSASTIATSDDRIWVDFDTNGIAGGRVYIAGAHSGLRSLAANFTINSSNGNLASMDEGFGAQALTASQSGGGPFIFSSPFDGGGDVIGSLNTTFQSIFSSSNPVSGGRGSFVLKAKASDITPASNDYEDILTIIAAGTY